MAYKDTKGKEKLSLIPRRALVEIAKVREFGNSKYGCPDGWKQCKAHEFAEAAMRHIVKHFDGTEKDPESGLDHLSHALCSLALAVSLKKIPNEETVAAIKEADAGKGKRTSLFDDWERFWEGL